MQYDIFDWFVHMAIHFRNILRVTWNKKHKKNF